MCQNMQKERLFDELDTFIDNLEDKSSSLIAVLHKAQEIFGYLPEEVQKHVAAKLQQPLSEVNGVVTFYSYFSEKPTGRTVINVCMGTACFVRGSGEILEEFERKLHIKVGETTEDERFTLQMLRCVGACGLAPVVTVNDRVYGHFEKHMVSKIIDEYNE
ncbi:MAG: NAD(P)H-dependent oxidoreductase subunit E [Butyrivibrio sp.]|nr:NAD(P)H-dependent oxidoreductase subunit E [Butyrivibrio sp.]